MNAINNITHDDVEDFRRVNQFSSALDMYQRIATKSAIYPGQGTPLGLAYVALKLNGEAGEFAEHVGKAMRDDAYMNGFYMDGGCVQSDNHTPLTPERRTALIKEIGDFLWYASAACNELGIPLSEAASINLEKLASRSERGKLRGSGDER